MRLFWEKPVRRTACATRGNTGILGSLGGRRRKELRRGEGQMPKAGHAKLARDKLLGRWGNQAPGHRTKCSHGGSRLGGTGVAY